MRICDPPTPTVARSRIVAFEAMPNPHAIAEPHATRHTGVGVVVVVTGAKWVVVETGFGSLGSAVESAARKATTPAPAAAQRTNRAIAKRASRRLLRLCRVRLLTILLLLTAQRTVGLLVGRFNFNRSGFQRTTGGRFLGRFRPKAHLRSRNDILIRYDWSVYLERQGPSARGHA